MVRPRKQAHAATIRKRKEIMQRARQHRQRKEDRALTKRMKAERPPTSSSHMMRKLSMDHLQPGSSGQSVQPKRTTWENIVLHYLSKLKNYWCNSPSQIIQHPHPRGCPPLANHKHKQQDNATPKQSDPSSSRWKSNNMDEMHENIHAGEILKRRLENSKHSAENSNRKKIVNIVSNALQYGIANGVVRRDGNYFCVKPASVHSEEESDEAEASSPHNSRNTTGSELTKRPSKPISIAKAKTIKIDSPCMKRNRDSRLTVYRRKSPMKSMSKSRSRSRSKTLSSRSRNRTVNTAIAKKKHINYKQYLQKRKGRK